MGAVADAQGVRGRARVGRPRRRKAGVPIAATDLDGLAVGAGAVWVTAPQDGLLWRIERGATRSIDVGAGARGVAVAGGAVWVANAARGTVTRVDPRDEPRRRGHPARQRAARARLRRRAALADARGRWRRRAGARRRARRERRGHRARLRRGVAGGGTPQRLIVSDMPLHQPGISHTARTRSRTCCAATTSAPAASDRLPVVRRLDRAAGQLRAEKCRSNADLYARTPRVDRHRRPVQLGLHRRAARDHQPRRPARDDLADEHGARAHEAGAGRRPGAAAESLPDRAPPLRPRRRHRQRPGRRARAASRTNAASAASRSCTTTTNTGAPNAWHARASRARLGVERDRTSTRSTHAAIRRERACARARGSPRPVPTRCSTRASRTSGPTGSEPPGFALVRELRARLGPTC